MSMHLQEFIRWIYIKFSCERGQGLSEYVLMIFLFAIAMMLSFSDYSTALQTLFTTIRAAFP